MKWSKTLFATTFAVISTQTFAGSLVNMQERLSQTAFDLKKDVIQMEYGQRSRGSKMEAIKKLSKMKRIIARMEKQIKPGGSGQIPTQPPYGNNKKLYSATCHIDDDTSLTLNEKVVGVIKANSIDALLSDCEAIAKSSYGETYSSFGINKLAYLGYIGPHTQAAECHIDDDTSLTKGEFIVGKVVGSSAQEIAAKCKTIAQATFGEAWSSSGIVKLNNGKKPTRNMLSAICHIDDDTSLTYNEFVVGTVFGNNVRDLTQECKDVAQMTFGQTWSSSGIRDIQ